MEAVKNIPKIEALYPLTQMQQALLFHHLTNNLDEGHIQVQVTLTGSLNFQIFTQAWDYAIQRHAVMRSTVHWEKLEKPVRVIHKEKPVQITLHHWEDLDQAQKNSSISELMESRQRQGFSFQKESLVRVDLCQISESQYYLLWQTHHLLLDGWSSNIIVTEVLNYYNSRYSNDTFEPEPLPSYSAYLRYIQENNKQQATLFWSEYFNGYNIPYLVDPESKSKGASINLKQNLSVSRSDKLRSFAKRNRLTPSTLIQTAWALILSNLFNTKDIMFGITVSGRSVDIHNFHLTAGMYMNVLPLRAQYDAKIDLKTWMQQMQTRQYAARDYEYLSTSEILDLIQWSESRTPFDTLLVFENYPETDQRQGVLSMTEFKSGLTSNFPLTLTVIPGNEMVLNVSYKEKVLDTHVAAWLLSGLLNFLTLFTRDDFDLQQKVVDVRLHLGVPPELVHKKEIPNREYHPEYIGDEQESRMLTLWQEVFGKIPIGLDDNFFQLGGKSFQALRLFEKINKQYNVKLSPNSILEFPTASSLIKLVSESRDGTNRKLKNLVAFRKDGTKKPLFFLHTDSGDVLVYRKLAESLGADRPIYFVQASGLDPKDPVHADIPSMANDYVEQIAEVINGDAVNLLAFCFSVAVGLEMSNILKSKGINAKLIVLDTKAGEVSLVAQSYLKRLYLVRLVEFIKRIRKWPFRSIRVMIKTRVDSLLFRFFEPGVRRQNLLVKDSLDRLFRNYHWPKYNGNIALILTKKNEHLNTEVIDSWKRIKGGDVEVRQIEASRVKMFGWPEVRELATNLDVLSD